MHPFVATARHVGLVCVALISVVAGAAALWGRLNPDRFASARTIELLSVLGLLFLPVCTVFVVQLHRRNALEAVDAETHAGVPIAPARPAEPARRDRQVTHAPHAGEARASHSGEIPGRPARPTRARSRAAAID